MTDELFLMAFCCKNSDYTHLQRLLQKLIQEKRDHWYQKFHKLHNLLSVKIIKPNIAYCSFHFINPSTCLEIAKSCHNDSKTYLLFAYKQSTQNSRCYKEPPANICRLISNSIATSVFVFICSILLELSFSLKSVKANSSFLYFV